ncbi:MAG TPA: NCS1 family nucleobase:cation symporter-1 [Pyrinomonadaceae bacterium]|nr:NCS1 family nucleobase:cation symporter-1 [Pyrinomonadaceae bacterium]HMP65904.1 NCS1 family nucleobase:cation symporter-1 [Pyrinomonadaceae bacterium]
MVKNDFIELNEDVSASPLWNHDLAPTTIEQRTWTTWNIAALWIGMSVVITTYMLGGGFIAQGMTWWQAMLTILLGNCIVLIPMVLNAHAGTKYGISFPVLLRASFGTTGANIPAMLRAIVACGWFGIQTWIGGTAIDALLTAVWSGWAELGGGAVVAGNPLHTWISFFLFWGIQVVIILRGIEAIKHLESWAAPLLLLGGLVLLIWASSAAGDFGNILAGTSALQETRGNFWAIFPAALTASVGYWATLSLNIPDFTRFAKSQRSQMLGQALGLPLTMTAFAFIGVAVTSATVIIYGEAIADPVQLIQRFDNRFVILFAMIVIFVAQISTNMAANVVSPSNDFSNLNPKRISYVTGGLITAVIGIAMMPWQLMSSMGAYIFTWLIGYSGLMGAIGGILICDYWLIRKRRIELADLYKINGVYSYSGGFNWRAITALVLAIAPVVPGFLRAATTPGGQVAEPNVFDTLYTYAWFVTFSIAFLIYFVLMNNRFRKQVENAADAVYGVEVHDL